MDVRGASALVTGAGRGIGRAVALKLARAGVRVTAVSRTASELEAVSRQAPPGHILACPGDLREPQFPARAVDAAVGAHGGLQILVNNAGIAHSAPFAETTDDAWDAVLSTNLTAVFRLTRAALPHLSVRGGHVLMISSLAGSNPVVGLSAYCASKAALDHLARCLMLEVRHQGIKVTTIAPGSVDTSFGSGVEEGGSWMLQAEDVASTIMDLLGTRDDAHLSRIEMRPLRPAKRM